MSSVLESDGPRDVAIHGVAKHDSVQTQKTFLSVLSGSERAAVLGDL